MGNTNMKRKLISRHLLPTDLAPIIVIDVGLDFLEEMLGDVVTVKLIFRLVRLGRLG